MSSMNVQMILNLLYNRAGAKDAVADLQAIEKAGASIGKTTQTATPHWIGQSRAIERMRAETQKLTGEMRAFESIGGVASASWSQGARNFSQISVEAHRATQEVRQLQSAIKSVASTSAGIGGGGASSPWGDIKPGAWAKRRTPITEAGNALPSLPSRHEKPGDKRGLFGTAMDSGMGAIAGYATVDKARDLAGRAIVAGQDATHSAISLETQGMHPDEIREVQRRASELSGRYKAFSRTAIEHMIGDAKTQSGDLHHAFDAMPDILRLRTIELGQTGHSSDEGTNAIVKGAELAGKFNDPKALHQYFETMAKLRNTYKGTFRPDDIRGFYEKLRVAGAKVSDEFMLGAGGHLMQEMRGETLGGSIAMLHRLAGGKAPIGTYATLEKLGVPLNKEAIEQNKTGGIKHVRPGVLATAEAGLLQSDPDKWLLKYLKPGLDKLPEDEQFSTLQGLGNNINALGFMSKVLQQHAVIEKARAITKAAPGLSAAETWLNKDPKTNREAFSAQFDNTLRAAGKPFGSPMMLQFGTGILAGLNKATDDREWMMTGAGAALLGGAVYGGMKLGAATAKGLGKKFAEGMGSVGESAATAAETAVEAARGVKPGFMDNAGYGKGLLKSPWDIAKGLYDGAAAGATDVLGAERAAAVGRGLVGTIKNGIVTGVMTAAGEYAIDKAFGALPKPAMPHGYDPEAELAKGPWQRAKELIWGRPDGIRVPTMADQQAAMPQVDTSQVDAAKQKATEAGAEIKSALEVTVAPKVDTSGVDALIAKAREAKAELAGLGSIGGGSGAGLGSVRSGSASGMRGAQRSSGALHDGTEVR